MAAENDFFLRFGTNADDFAGEVDSGIEAAISSVERLGDAVDQLSQKMQGTVGGDLLQGLRGDLRSISNDMATTFGSELRGALERVLPEALRGVAVTVQPNVQTGSGPTNISSTPPQAVPQSGGATQETAAIFKSEMQGVAKIMATTISTELQSALRTGLPEAIQAAVQAMPRTSPASALGTPDEDRIAGAARRAVEGSTQPAFKSQQDEARFGKIPESYQKLYVEVQKLAAVTGDLVRQRSSDVTSTPVAASSGRRAGGRASEAASADEALGDAQRRANELGESLDAVAEEAGRAGTDLGEAVQQTSAEVDELNRYLNYLSRLLDGILMGNPGAAKAARGLVDNDGVPGKATGSVGLDPESIELFTRAASEQLQAAQTFTEATNSFKGELPKLLEALKNIRVEAGSGRRRPKDAVLDEEPPEPGGTPPPSAPPASVGPSPEEVAERDALVKDMRQVFTALKPARVAREGEEVDLVGLLEKVPRDVMQNFGDVLGPEADIVIEDMVQSGAKFKDVVAAALGEFEGLETSTQQVSESNRQLAEAQDAAKDAVQRGVRAGAEQGEGPYSRDMRERAERYGPGGAIPEREIGPPSGPAGTAASNRSARLARQQAQELEGVLTGRTPEGVTDISLFDETGVATVLADSIESGLDRQSVLSSAAESLNLQEPMRTLVQNVTQEMVDEARKSLREAGQSSRPTLSQAQGGLRTRPIASVVTAADDPRIQNLERITNAAQLRRATTDAGGASLIEQLERRQGPMTDLEGKATQQFDQLLDQFFQVLELAVPAERATELRSQVEAQREGLQQGDSREGLFQALQEPFAEVRAEATRLDDVLRQTISPTEFEQYRTVARMPAGSEPGQFDATIELFRNRIERLNTILDTQMSTGGGMSTLSVDVPQGTMRAGDLYARTEGYDGPATGAPLGRDAARSEMNADMQIVNAAELKVQALSQAVAERAIDMNASVEALGQINAETDEDKEILARVRAQVERIDSNIVDRITEVANQAGVESMPGSSLLPGSVPGVSDADIERRNQAAARMAEREMADRAAQQRIEARLQASGRNLVVRRDARGRVAGEEWSEGRFDLGGASPTQMRRSGLRSMAERVVIPQQAGGDGRTLAFLRNMSERDEQPNYLRPQRQDQIMERFREAPQAGRDIITAFNQLADLIVSLNEKVLLRGEAESTLEALRQVEAVQPLDERDLEDRRAAERVMEQTGNVGNELAAALDLMYKAPDPMSKDPLERQRWRTQGDQSVSELVYGFDSQRKRMEEDAADVPPIQYAREAGMASRRQALMRRHSDDFDFGGLDPTSMQDVSTIDAMLAEALNPDDIERGRQELGTQLMEAVRMSEEAFAQEEAARQALVDVLNRDKGAVENALQALARSLGGVLDAPDLEAGREALRGNQAAKDVLQRSAELRPLAEVEAETGSIGRVARGAGTQQDLQRALEVFTPGDDPISSLRDMEQRVLGPALEGPEAEALTQRRMKIFERGAELEQTIERMTNEINNLPANAPSTDDLIQKRTVAQAELRNVVSPALTDVEYEINQIDAERSRREQIAPGLAQTSRLSDNQLMEALTNPQGLSDRPEIIQALQEASSYSLGELTDVRRQEQYMAANIGEQAGIGPGQVAREGITTIKELFQALRRLADASDQASDSVQRLPEVEEGFTRLYRGSSGEDRPDATVDTGPTAGFRGRYFTPDEEMARGFAESSGGALSYVDVPTDTLGQIRSGDTPEAAYMALKEATEGSTEVVLPQEWVDKAQEVSTVLENIPQKILREEQTVEGRRRSRPGEGRTGIDIPNTESERLSLFDYLSGVQGAKALPDTGGKPLLNVPVETVMDRARQYQGKTPEELGVNQATYTRTMNQLATLAGDTRFDVTDPVTKRVREGVSGLNYASDTQLRRMGRDPKISTESVISPELVAAAEESRRAAVTTLSQDADIAGARERAIEGNTNKLLIDVLGKLESSLTRLGDCCDNMKNMTGTGEGDGILRRGERGIERAQGDQLRAMLGGTLNETVGRAVAEGNLDVAALEIKADPNMGPALTNSQIAQLVSNIRAEQTGLSVGDAVSRDDQRAMDTALIQANKIRGFGDQGLGGREAFDAYRSGGTDEERMRSTGEALMRATGDVDGTMARLVEAFLPSSESADQLRVDLESLQQQLTETSQSAQQLIQAEKDALELEKNQETGEQRAMREMRGREISTLYDPTAEDIGANAVAVGREQLMQNPEQSVARLVAALNQAYGGMEAATLRQVEAELRKTQEVEQSTAALHEAALAENARRDTLSSIRELLPEPLQQRMDAGDLTAKEATDFLDYRTGRGGDASIPVQRQIQNLFEGEDIGRQAQNAVNTYVANVQQGLSNARTPVQRSLEMLFGGRGSVLQNVTRTAGNFIARYMGGALVFGFASRMREMTSSALETEQTYIRVTAALEATGRSTDNVRSKLQDIAIDTAVSVQDTYEVMAQLAGVFETTEETLEATKVVNQLELISQGALSTKEAYTALTAVTAAFQQTLQEPIAEGGKGFTDLEAIDYVADLATRIQDLTGVNIEDTTQGLARLGETANTLGIEMELIASAIALTVKATGQSGQGASEQIGRIMAQFQNADAQDLLVGLGITDQQTVLAGDFNQVMKDLFTNYSDLTSGEQRQIANTLGDPRQFAMTNALLNQGANALETYGMSLNAAGAAAERQEAVLGTLRGQMRSLGVQIEAIVQNLVEMGLLNVFSLLVRGISLVLTPLVELLQLTKNLKDSSPFASWGIDIAMFLVGLRVVHAAIGAMTKDAARMFGAEGSMGTVGDFVRNRRAARAERPARAPILPTRESIGGAARRGWGRFEAFADGPRPEGGFMDSFRAARGGRRATEAIGDATVAAARTGGRIDPAEVSRQNAKAAADAKATQAATARAGADAAGTRAAAQKAAADTAGAGAATARTAADTAGTQTSVWASRINVQAARSAAQRVRADGLVVTASRQVVAAKRLVQRANIALANALNGTTLAATRSAVGGSVVGGAVGRGAGAAARGAGAMAGRAVSMLASPMGLMALALAVPMVVSAFQKGTREIGEAIDQVAEARAARLEQLRTQDEETGETDESKAARTRVQQSREENEGWRSQIGESARVFMGSPIQGIGRGVASLIPGGGNLFGMNQSAADAIAGVLPEDTQEEIDRIRNDIIAARNSGDEEGARALETDLLEAWEEMYDDLDTVAQKANFEEQVIGLEGFQEGVVNAIVRANMDMSDAFDYTLNNVNQLVSSFSYLQGLDANAMAKYGEAIRTIISTTSDLPDEAEQLLSELTRPGLNQSNFLAAQDEVLEVAYQQTLLEIEQIGDSDPEKLERANETLRGIVQQRAQLDQLILQQLTDVPLRRADINRRMGNLSRAEADLRDAAQQWKVRAANERQGSAEEMDAIVGHLDALREAAELSIMEEVFQYELLNITTRNPLEQVSNQIQIARLRMEAYAATPGMADEVRQQLQEIAQLQMQLADEQNNIADAYAQYSISLIRNPLEQANAEYSDAMRRYQRALDQDEGILAVLEAIGAVEEAARSQREAAEQYRAATAQLRIAQMPRGATLSRAMAELAEVYADQRNVIREFGRNSAEYVDSMARVIETQRGIEDEIRNIISAQYAVALAFANAAGLNIESSRIELEQARAELQQALSDAGGDQTAASVRQAYANVLSAEAAMRDQVLDEALGTIDFMMDMEEITANEAIAAIREIMNTMDLTEQQTRDLRRRIKQLQDDISSALSGGFNIADVRLPTPYEVRRSLGVDTINEGVEEGQQAIRDAFDAASQITGGTGAVGDGILDRILGEDLAGEIRGVGKGVDDLLPPISEIPSHIKATLDQTDSLVAEAERQLAALISLEESQNASVSALGAVIQPPLDLLKDSNAAIDSKMEELNSLAEVGNDYLATSASLEAEGNGYLQEIRDGIMELRTEIDPTAPWANIDLPDLPAGMSWGSDGLPYIPGRWTGGAVAPHRPYKVGEYGEELFVPNTAGQIVSANDLNAMRNTYTGGDTHITHQTFQTSVSVQAQTNADPDAIARAVERKVTSGLKRQINANQSTPHLVRMR